MDIAQIQQQITSTSSDESSTIGPPVDQWDPPFCGDMNLVIKRNGQWWHEGTPFTRAKLIKLFSSVIKKENNHYFLVTPVEKIGITVEDVPFIVIDSQLTEIGINVITQTGDVVTLDDNHPVEIRNFDGSPVPYCNIRRNLWARVHQNVLYRWIDEAKCEPQGEHDALFLKSKHYRFCIGKFKTIE